MNIVFRVLICLELVWTRIKVANEFHRNLLVTAEAGFSMLYALGIVGVISTSTVATLKQVDDGTKAVVITRAYQRRNILEDQVRRSSESVNALYSTAKKMKSTPLSECVLNQKCVPTRGADVPYTLYDSMGNKISNTSFYFNGDECKKSRNPSKPRLCPLKVDTWYRIECGDGESFCQVPKKITTRYRIESSKDRRYRGPVLRMKDPGETSLAGFRCDPNQYMIGINDSGMPECRNATYIPPGGLNCQYEDEYPFGLSSSGTFLCREVTNYCISSVYIVLVIDVSGSMNMKDKMKKAKSAAKRFINKLRPQDHLSIVTFAKKSRTLINFTNDKNALNSAVDRLKAKGRTNMTAGLKIADKLTDIPAISGGKKPVIIFLSDGIHNKGSGPSGLANDIRKRNSERKKQKKPKKKVITIAFGEGADQKELKNIATDSKSFHDASNLNIEDTFKNIGAQLCR